MAAVVTTITCTDCGAERHNVQYRNTRYCESCRLLRNLIFLGDRTCTCSECAKEFAPTVRGERWCGECSVSADIGDCVLCQAADSELLRRTIPVCLRCAHDPDRRAVLIKGLRRGQRDRREANHHPTEGGTP